ncbi:unnamed protein product [Closterium sp. NIES-64]|nr:unnamed protein product [Closterium sp. NIES-64]
MAYLFPSQVVSIRPLRAVRPDDGRELPLRNLKIPLKHLNLPPSKAAPRVRTRDHSLTIKCDAGKPVRPADLSTAEIAFVEIEPSLPIDTGIETRKLGEEEGESNGGKGESNVRPVRGEEPGDRGSGDRGSGDKRSGRRAEKTSRGGESCEEEEAVAIIARVLRGKFGPQIVREEDGGGSREGGKEIKEGGEEKEVEEAERVKEEEGVPVCEMEDGEGREDDIKAEFSEEELPGSTSFFTPAMPLKGARATSPSSLLSLYRFFSSHLGISSPSTVASLLASHPALLRSDPASDLLPRVRLLQSYGISQATIVHVTITNASWLRSSLPQIQGTIEFILARGVRRSKLGMVIRGSPYLIRSHARSTNLDILVEAAGIPEEKLGVIIERCPNILCRSEESIQDQIKLLSDYLSDGFEEKGTEEDTSSSTGHLKQHLKKHKNRQRLDKKILLTRLLLNYPRILLSSSDRISANLSLLQSFTPPDSPSIAIPVLRHAPSILNLGSENLLAKLQFFVELVGKKAAGRVVSSHPLVLTLSKENLEGKVAVLSGLIGPENAALAVARFPLLLTSGEETMKQNYAELLREFQEALEGGGGDEGGIEGLEAGGIGEAKEGDGEYRSQNGKQEGISGVGEGSVNGVEELARKLVINLAVKSPQCVYYSWDGNMRHKVEYLKREMGLSIMEVLAFPPFLGFNLDRRIKTRHAALLQLGYDVVSNKTVALQKLSSNRKGAADKDEERGNRDEDVDGKLKKGLADVGNGEDEWQEEEADEESNELLVRPHEDTESANVRFYPPFDGKPVPAVGTETRMRTDGREEGESEGGESEKSESGVGRGEVYGRGERTRRETRERKLEEKVEAGRWKRGGRGLCKATEEEEAVAMIAEFLREKFGPQIVIKEEGGSINGRIMDQEEDKGRQEEEEEEYGDEETEGSKVEEEDGGEGNEGEDAAVVAKEEVGSPITSPPTRPPPPRNGPRAVSPSSLLSLYRFFSSHLGISSPSIVASLLASHPSLLRSDPTNDFLPRVQLLQSYGVSRADTSAITMKNAYWLRLSLPQVRDMLDFLLARGILRTKLGAVLRKSPYLIGARARSTNLDILVERAGVPVDKLPSFTPPDSPSVAIPILSQAPSLVHLSSQTLLSKLQYFVGVVGKKAAGSVVRSYSSILILSVENMRGKVALLGDLIGRENAVLAVARFPRLLSSSGENIQMCFRELVREVEAAMEESGGEEVRRQMLEEGARKLASGGSGRAFKSIAGATIAHEMVVNLVVKNPAVICYNWEWNTRHKVDYLKRDMGLPVTEVLAYPHFLGYSLDQRIRPRHLALLSKGYVLVPHEVALPNNRGEGGGKLEGVSSERRAEGKDEDVKVDYGEDEVGVVHEAESATLRFEPSFDDEPVLPVGTEARLRAEGRDEGESEGGKSEKSGSRLTRAREVEDKVAGGGWTGERGGCKETEEEEKAVAMIAGVLREKFGPQIVTEEEYEGSTNERITDQEEAKGRQGEEEVGYGGGERGGVEAESEEDEEWKEGEDAEPEAELEAEAEESEEDAPPTTCPPKRPPPPYYGPRVVSLSSLLSLYRFFSSHLGISSPSTVASLLASHPALLRSDPTSDLLPRVHLLQSYGVSRPDISAITMRKSSWLRLSLSHLQEMLDFLLARGGLEKLLGKKTVGIVVRSHPSVLNLSFENLQGKVALLGDLIGQGNAELAVARHPLILTSSEENFRRNFRELVREVEEALESGGEAGSGTQRLGEGALKHDAREYAEQGGSGAEIPAKTTSWAEASATARAGERRGFKSIAGATTACELVANLVVKFPNSICFSWERITSHKVEYLKRDMGLPITEVIKFPFFLGYSLDRRIRPRHVALLSKGYVFVPHEVALPVKGGERAEYKALEDGEDEGEKAEYGVGKHERGTAMDPTQDNSVALGKRGVSWQQERKAVCLGQLLLCSDHIFERRFDVELAPFLP